MHTHTRQGFTLIELIIVVVILGVLASIGLSRITVQLDKIHAAEAFNFGGAFVKAFDRCVTEITGGTYTPGMAEGDQCNSWAELSMYNPNLNPNNFFTYSINDSSPFYRIRAQSKTDPFDNIALSVAIDTGAVTTICGGKFISVCK